MSKDYGTYMSNQGFVPSVNLDQAVRAARREALEEAARMAEEKTAGWFDERAYVGQSIAAAIRALKEK